MYYRNDPPGFVYFLIENTEHPKKVKIGHSWNVKLRTRNLSNTHKMKLQCLYRFEFKDQWCSKHAENLAHQRLASFRIKGEWFQFNEEVCQLALEMASSQFVGRV